MNTAFASIAQAAERILGKDEVSSSNLLRSSNKNIEAAKQARCFYFERLIFEPWSLRMMNFMNSLLVTNLLR